MNILLSRMRAVAFFALFWGAWFNAAVGGPVEALSKLEKTVLYREPSLWERHLRLILATAAILVLQSLFIVGFILQRSRWKRAEQSLRDSGERMNLAAEAALRLLLTQREFDTEYRLLLPDSDVRWIATRGQGIFDNQNRAVRLLGVSIDITARKLAHLELQQQRDELAHLSRVTTLGEMATTLAHELNQPLGAIHTNAEAAEILLQKNPPDLDELRAILKEIREDGWRAGEVIRRMRSLLKRHQFKMEQIEVEGLVEALGGLLQAVVISREARLRIEVASALPPVLGDAVHLQQVLLNLILNALEAMIDCPIGEREVIVRGVPFATSGVEVTVTDQGPGFSKEKLARLFEPFSRQKRTAWGLGWPSARRSSRRMADGFKQRIIPIVVPR